MNGQTLDPRVQMADLLVQFRVVEVFHCLIAWSLLMRRPALHLLLQTLGQLLPVSIRARLTEQGKVEPWINRKFARKHRLAALQLEEIEGLGFVRPRIRDAVQTIVTLTRQLTYASPSNMESRYPYLDQTLVEFLMSVPQDQLLRPGQRRSLMRRALAGLLPEEVLSRKTKPGAGRCYSIALERHWDRVSSVFHSPLSSRLGYVDRHRIHEALTGMKNGQIPNSFLKLLKALSLELWLRDIEARGVISLQPFVQARAGARLQESRV
jgi:asparagine synthase (glutamine-hydrolysing)